MSINNGESALFEAITAANVFNDICGDNYASRFKINKHHVEFALSCTATNSYVYKRITQYYRKPESLEKLIANIQEFKDAMTKAIERQKVKDKWDPRLQAKRDVKSFMKANEFVKSFGWSSLEIAKTLPRFNRCKYVIFYADKIDFSNEFHAGRKSYMFEVIEVERLVESHELVVQCGGLEGAKSHLESIRFNIATKTWLGSALLNWSMYADNLEKAIADVESCMGVG